MSSAGTLLSDLEGKTPNSGGNDDDLIRQIMQDVHAPTQQQQAAPSMGLPPPQVSSYKIQQPNASSIYQQSADPTVPTAHMIGNSHPNQADFAQMMMASGPAGSPYMYSQQQQQQQYPIPAQQQQQQQQYQWKSQLFDELRQPLLIAIIVFILSLPAVNVLFSQYAPTLLRSGGDLNNMGLLARALIAGAAYWIFQRVIGPLMK
jgi:hypothetical protein